MSGEVSTSACENQRTSKREIEREGGGGEGLKVRVRVRKRRRQENREGKGTRKGERKEKRTPFSEA